MVKRNINIAGFTITQLSESEYEATNPKESLDFYFNANNKEEIEIFVFDSLISTKGEKDPFLAVFYANCLEEAVADSMTFTKESLIRL